MKSVGLFLFIWIIGASSQKYVGESCVDSLTGKVGVCTPEAECYAVKENFQDKGIPPTFCAHRPYNKVLICCSNDTSEIASVHDKPPKWINGKRVSEKKCEEYSRSVVETIASIPLTPDQTPTVVTAARCDNVEDSVIIGMGGEDARLGEFPHMAAVGWLAVEGGYIFPCGGSLISPNFVLSAGHCAKYSDAKEKDPVIVRLGDLNIDPLVDDGADPVDIPITQVIMHPSFRPPKVYNDIALMQLATPAVFTKTVRPACLWTGGGFKEKTQTLATGWGVLNPYTRETAKVLQKVQLSLFDNKRCDRLLALFRSRKWSGFESSQMCAGDMRGGKDTCQGDSGAPLQIVSSENRCIFYVIGVTSFGRSCGEAEHPGVYTRVNSYLDWIEEVVWAGE